MSLILITIANTVDEHTEILILGWISVRANWRNFSEYVLALFIYYLPKISQLINVDNFFVENYL